MRSVILVLAALASYCAAIPMNADGKRAIDMMDRDADANVVYPDAYIESRGLEIEDRDADANVVYPDAYIESRGLEIEDRDADANVVYPDAYIEE